MDFIPCTTMQLPDNMQESAARIAIEHNSANGITFDRLQRVLDMLSGSQPTLKIEPQHLALVVNKYWGSGGVKLTVGFPFDTTPVELQMRIVNFMNMWSPFANIKFVLTGQTADVRIARANTGYWSYIGTDIRSIPINQPTMNLQGITMLTPDSECERVIPHETGHTCGFPHEHMRPEMVAELDVGKTIEYFQRTQGWDANTVRQQVLTPLTQSSIRGTPTADQDSIMCYQLPGSITKSGRPIRGGLKIDTLDQQFANREYPLSVTPPVQKDMVLTFEGTGMDGKYKLVKI